MCVAAAARIGSSRPSASEPRVTEKLWPLRFLAGSEC
eukprot:COSAG01_NODE_29471_length_636_cov_3.553073_1_plen_36_part_10